MFVKVDSFSMIATSKRIRTKRNQANENHRSTKHGSNGNEVTH